MHIVVICVDAMRADHIGCYAGDDRGTPVMDGIAAEGIWFRNATAQAPWTRPAVTSIMTGLYPSQHVMTDAPKACDGAVRMVALDQALPTLPGTLAGAGWSTASFVAGNAYLKPDFGVLGGFDHLEWLTTIDGDAVVDRFEAWLSTPAAAREHTFAYLHLMETHNPLPAGLAPARPQVDKGIDLTTAEFGEETLRRYYAESVSRADQMIGRILDALDARGRLDDTWITVTADHGEELNEHGYMLSHGQSLYRSLVQVPLLMRRPGHPYGGRLVVEPVSHIDLFPTFLEAAGLAVPPLPGHSLLGVLDRGEAPANPGGAFSELAKRVKYCRSITTATHHLIETFHLSAAARAEPSALVAGVTVEVKGQPVEGGTFVPTKISIDPKGAPKVLGAVEDFDLATGWVTVMGVRFEVDSDTRLVGLDKEPFEFSELALGDRVSAEFAPNTPLGGPYRAKRLMRRKPGGESKLEGPIQASRDNGHRWFTLLGRDVPVDPAVRIVDRNDDVTEWKRDAVVEMVRQGRYLSRTTELYAFERDPLEQHNLVGAEPGLTGQLEGVLTAWAEGITAGQAGEEIAVDDATVEQLRALGYL